MGPRLRPGGYYNAVHVRFTSVDPLTASATIRNPQTFNRYTYVLNSPYKFTDPLGRFGKKDPREGSGPLVLDDLYHFGVAGKVGAFCEVAIAN
ncbi:MAG: hypothetical protein KF831_03450 [Acidobacteria bacterium]|nr:hypothetical protein [Acidobacteriota bacterium]